MDVKHLTPNVQTEMDGEVAGNRCAHYIINACKSYCSPLLAVHFICEHTLHSSQPSNLEFHWHCKVTCKYLEEVAVCNSSFLKLICLVWRQEPL